jgi:hypothetical protein
MFRLGGRMMRSFRDSAIRHKMEDVYEIGFLLSPVAGFCIGGVAGGFDAVNGDHDRKQTSVDITMKSIDGALVGCAGGMLFCIVWPGLAAVAIISLPFCAYNAVTASKKS